SNVKVAFLPRHGRGHRFMPAEIPSRANIYALKSLGVEQVIAINSVGSFREDVKPGHLLIPDQLVDRTSQRQNTFFGEGIVAHVPFAEPFCPNLRTLLFASAREAGAEAHPRGTYVVMEGPAFSTRAESQLHQAWGSDVIGMTALPEAKLAREAEMCYAVVALATDFDAWHEAKEAVSVEAVLSVMRRNIELAKRLIKLAAAHLAAPRLCGCTSALAGAIMTDLELIPDKRKKELALIIGKYLS
ncbi:MAG: MTAP family purine nucleoside phosphorylase, partial [Dehalococcoidia bacterium]|nr:MTAP family purine nucleoside phosphorylase [Dehalococcoidia bacterium]